MSQQKAISAISVTWEPMFTYKDVETLTRLSGRTIARLVSANQFPKPIRFGHSCRWRRQDIARFLETGGER
jgi:predicted DNA-binding transcriptional regulator AlpA